jgi:hypothetical protein
LQWASCDEQWTASEGGPYDSKPKQNE